MTNTASLFHADAVDKASGNRFHSESFTQVLFHICKNAFFRERVGERWRILGQFIGFWCGGLVVVALFVCFVLNFCFNKSFRCSHLEHKLHF